MKKVNIWVTCKQRGVRKHFAVKDTITLFLFLKTPKEKSSTFCGRMGYVGKYKKRITFIIYLLGKN